VEAKAMIRDYRVQSKFCTDRISFKTLDGTFRYLIETGANCSPFVSSAILNTAKKVYRLQEADKEHALRPGQMKIIGVATHEPSGKRISECQMRECVVTVYADHEDNQVRAQHGTTGLRRAKLLRIATEAWEQGVLLSHEDFAYRILHCGLRTIARDIKYFKDQNIFVPTRGQQMDIGPGTSHKVLAVEHMIQRKDEYEISKRIYHSLNAIERYTTTFARVVLLKENGLSLEEIAFVVQHSQRLVREYLDLYQRYKDQPSYQERLDEIIGKAQNMDHLTLASGSGKKRERS
jgi:hypothetical protein